LLRGLSDALRTMVRDSDIVARFGGEEFVLALPDTDLAGARLLARRILQCVEAVRWEAAPKDLTVTASVGIASLGGQRQPTPAKILDDLVASADRAMYEAKRRGRNRACAFSDLDSRTPDSH
jgi:diguanylate cyclase (GGDEF)-like protein